MTDLTNAERARAGCAPLVIDAALDASAQAWSVESAATDPDTSVHSPAAGQAYAENVAWNYPSAEAVVAAWMDSPGHRANILNCSYTRIGTGHATSADGEPYWTQQFT